MTISKHLTLLLVFIASGLSVFGQYKTTSIFSEGSFYKLSVEQEGVYKLDKSFFESLPNTTSLNPKNIALFGNIGGMLPEAIALDRIDDVEEIPMKFVGNDDNEFQSNEYFLFYAQGPNLTTYENGEFRRKNNVYEFKNYYFLSTDISAQKKVEKAQWTANSGMQITTYDNYQKFDKDLINVLGKNFGTQGSGKTWYGAEYTNDRLQDLKSQFNLNDIVDGSDLIFRLEMLARSDKTSSMTLRVNKAFKNQTFSSVNLFDGYASYGSHRRIDLITPYNESEGIEHIEVEVFAGSTRYSSWIDFLSMQSEKHLKYSGSSFHFRKLATDPSVRATYRLTSSQPVQVWHVSDPHAVSEVTLTTSSGGYSFEAPVHSEFVVFGEQENIAKPKFEKVISPQNVHSIMDAEYVILYHKNFEASAKRLGDHRASIDGLITYVIDVDHVFNEFGGGSKDPIAIRDFVRMLYKRSGTFQYLCLFGDASYDYRGIDKELPMDNYIPCYQTDESLSPVYGFPTDDFYALLSDTEGDDLKGGLDIAVGRLPVASVQEANTVVDKLIAYDLDKTSNGEWKNNFIFVADDEDNNNHLNQSERLAKSVFEDRPQFNQRKVYLDGFLQQSTTGDDRYPDAKQKLNDYIFQGALLLNYFGHGGPNGWAQERVLEIQDILSWKNGGRLPLFITATCTFTGYDDPADKSGGELTLLNPNGGSIGLVSTTRAVTISANERLVNSMFEYIYDKEDNQFVRMGEVLRLAKNNHRSDTLERNARKFALIGDPAFRLSFPEYQASITSFQQEPVGSGTSDTIRALDEVVFSGEIIGFEGEKLENFQGHMEVTVMDKAQDYRTLANDIRSYETTYKAYNAFIFKGNTEVVNGEFTVRFRVPKDIDYEYGNGRISLYASHNATQEEASGYYDDFIIGGTSKTVVEDDQPPTISLFLNNTFFEDGDATGPDPLMIAQVKDDLGINLSTTSIGHEMIAILDEDLPNQIVLNDYYKASPNSFTEGVIEFPFNDLEEGEHTLRVRVWDVANNPAEATLSFVVEKGQINHLENVMVTPNPAVDVVQFSFTHQLSYAPVNVYIVFYDQLGRPVSELKTSVTTGGNSIENLEWNRVGYHGATLPSGVYYYKITASAASTSGEEESATSAGGKIVLLN